MKHQKLQWENLNKEEKKIIEETTNNIRMIGILLPGISLLWGRCYLTAILFLLAEFLIPGVGSIGGRIAQYIYLPEWSFNNSEGFLIKLIEKNRDL